MIKASIIGATGYVGAELIRILYAHPNVELAHLVSHSQAGSCVSDIYPNLTGYSIPPFEENINGTLDSDVIFTALPHGAAADTISKLSGGGAKIIDMSADFRYKDESIYEYWYKKHPNPQLLKSAVYGLPELHKDEIKSASIVGNPGCYTTCSILALAPLAKLGLIDMDSIIIDAASGVTGAGRAPSQAMHFPEVHENFKAYNVAKHRHTSEIEQELGILSNREVVLSFTPHLLPVKRGILATCYAKLNTLKSASELLEVYRGFYAAEPFVKIFDEGILPELKSVNGSNNVHIGLVCDPRTGRVIVLSALDNLIKGAAGQAVQNMNLLFGLDEKTGLDFPALYL